MDKYKILITTGLSGADIGGPFQYAPHLKTEFQKMGHEVKVVSYGKTEISLPVGVRHLYFFIKVMLSVLWADKVIALDTFSVGVPSMLATKLFKKMIMIRVGGDFLWESYVERTGEKITLKQFNSNFPNFNLKEKIILYFTKFLINYAEMLVFNTEWQREIWQRSYHIPETKTAVIRNFIPEKQEGNKPKVKNFLWAGRRIKLKNLELMKDIPNIEIMGYLSHDQLMGQIRDCYAVILPSFSEVCPNFILEAASFGKPFIVTEETGLKEIYNTGGIFINPFDKIALKQAILDMLDQTKYTNYVKELISTNQSHSWQEIANKFLSIHK